MLDRIVKADEGDAPDARRTFSQWLADEGLVMQRAFRRFVNQVLENVSTAQITRWMEEKDLRGFLSYIGESVDEMADTLPQAFARTARREIDRLNQPGRFGVGKLKVSFDPGNSKAARVIERARLNLIREFTRSQRDAVRESVAESLKRGEGAEAAARRFRNVIGLTRNQARAVNTYQSLLERGSSEALGRQLRDRRFDGTINRVIENDDSLSSKQILRMTQRYAENMRNARALTIARTEMMRTLNQAKQASWAQMADELGMDPDDVERTWIATLDDRVRDTHEAMDRQTVTGLDTPFESPSGEELLYPGDPMADGSETINCRCTLVVKFPRSKMRMAKAFNPDEPRDKDGKWTTVYRGIWGPDKAHELSGGLETWSADQSVAESYATNVNDPVLLAEAGGKTEPRLITAKLTPKKMFQFGAEPRPRIDEIAERLRLDNSEKNKLIDDLDQFNEKDNPRFNNWEFGDSKVFHSLLRDRGYDAIEMPGAHIAADGSKSNPIEYRVLDPSALTRVGMAPVVRKAFNPDEPRDENGQWTFVARPKGWEAGSDEVAGITRPGHFYRGMSEAEYTATLGSGKGIKSNLSSSIASVEGTNFADNAGDAESYANYGRDDPRKTGKANYLVEVKSGDNIKPKPDGYFHSRGEVPASQVTRVWRMHAHDGAVVATQLNISKAFDPDEPRDEHGKWTTGGGEPLKTHQDLGMSHEDIQRHIDKVCKDLNFDKSRFDISDESYTFDLNGQQMSAAGVAFRHNGRITMFARQLNDQSVDGILAHEIEHQKFNNALARYRADSDKLMKDPGPPPNPDAPSYPERRGGTHALMTPDGELRGPFRDKYPDYTAMHDALYQHDTEAFASTDGVSAYSNEYWKGWREGTIPTDKAYHETLAEMARIRYETGSFPEHTGHQLLSVRGKDAQGEWKPKPTRQTVLEGQRRWRKLFRVVEGLSR